MMKSVLPFSFLVLISCSTEVQMDMPGYSLPATTVNGSDEVLANYRNMPIVLEKKESGDQSYFIQEIEQQKEDVVFRMQKIPTELYLKNGNTAMPDSVLSSALAELEGEQLFYFEIEETMRQDLMKKYHTDDYDKAVSYISFDIMNDFSIVTESGDTLKPSYTLYERNFHLAPFERIIIDFKGLDKNEAFEMVYYDKMFGKGAMVFSFPDQKFVDNNIKELL